MVIRGTVALGVGAVVVCGLAPAARAVSEPTVDSVLAAATKAVGGQAAVDRIKTLHVVTATGSGEQAVEFDSSWSRSGGRLVKVAIPQVGPVVKGSDGTTAWQSMPMVGYSIMTESETAQLNMQVGLHIRMLDFQKTARDDMKTIEVAGKERFAEHECIALAYTKKKGGEGTIYFDAESGLPMGVVSSDGARKSTSIFGDWKAVEGVKFFHSIKSETVGAPRGGKAEMTVKRIEVNTLKDADFALPEEVKKLAAEKKAPAAGGAEGAIRLEDLPADQRDEAKNSTDAFKVMTVEQLKQQQQAMEIALGYMPKTDPKRRLMEYIAQELQGEIKKRGG